MSTTHELIAGALYDDAIVNTPAGLCRECGQPFRPEGSVICDLDKILCVPCIGAALARITS